jgi:hypothetical protein
MAPPQGGSREALGEALGGPGGALGGPTPPTPHTPVLGPPLPPGYPKTRGRSETPPYPGYPYPGPPYPGPGGRVPRTQGGYPGPRGGTQGLPRGGTQDLGVGYPGPPSRYPPYPGGVSRDPPYPGGVPRTQGGYPGPTQGGYLGSPRRSSGRSARLIKSPTWGTPLRTRDDGFHPALDWATHAVSASDPKGPNLVAMGTPKVVLGCLRPQDLRQGGRGLLVPTAGPPGPVLGLQRAFYPQELAFSGTPLGKNSQRLLDPSAFIPRCVFCSPTDYN